MAIIADRTVSVALRADVTAYIAAMRAAERATRRIGEEAQRAGRQAADGFGEAQRSANRLEQALQRLARQQQEAARRQRENSDEMRRNSEETRRHSEETDRGRQSQDRLNRSTQQAIRGMTANRSTLVSLAAGAALMGAAITSAAVAAGAFGLVAAPSILKVVSAQEDLVGSWSSLSKQQRISSIGVQNLVTDYKNLAASYEPEALRAFNTVVGTTRGLLPQLGNLVNQTSGSMQGFVEQIAGFVDERVGGEFLTWAGQKAPRALDLLGQTMVTAGDTALDLVQDVEPVGVGLLSMANGALGLVNGLAGVNPMLAQFAVSAILLRAPVAGLIAGVGNMNTRMRASAAAGAGLSRSTRLLNAVTAAGPNLYLAAGVGLAFLALKATSATSSTEKLIKSLSESYKASGNNVFGYQQLANTLSTQLAVSVEQTAASQRKLRGDSAAAAAQARAGNRVAAEAASKQRELKSAIDEANKSARDTVTGADQVAQRYGLTRDAAIRLADAAGVKLAGSLDKSGKLTLAATQKLDQWKTAAEQANNSSFQMQQALKILGDTTATLDQRTKALAASYNAQLGPALSAVNATIQLKQGYQQLEQQLGKTKAGINGNSAASLQLQASLSSQIDTVWKLFGAERERTGSVEKATAAVGRQLPVLYAMAGQNTALRAGVDALARATGNSVGATAMSRTAFMAQATAMGITRGQAAALWMQYQRLAAAQTTGSAVLTTYIGRVRASAQASKDLAARTGAGTASQGAYNTKVGQALPVLYALAGRNREARAQVDALARATGHATGATNISRAAFLRVADSMGIAKGKATQLWREFLKIKSRKVDLDVNAKGRWSASAGPQGNIDLKRGAARGAFAAGGPIPEHLATGPGGPTSDDVPIWASVGEHMWTADEVQRVGGHGAMMRLRSMAKAGQLRGYATGGEIRGYATGGAIDLGSKSASVGRVLDPVYRGMNSLIIKIGDTYAAAWKRFAGSGGPVVAAARSQLGVPYVWGGTAWNQGLDCSGLTSQAWQRGAGKWIGRTTYAQYPASSHLSGPRPAALGFPHMGHVVLASGNGKIIEAPFTGASVREVPISRHYEWRWPNAAAGHAEGGEIRSGVRKFGQDYIAGDLSRGEVGLARRLGVAGDPSQPPGYATGGEIHNAQISQSRSGQVRVWSEPETGGEAYIPLARSKRGRSTQILSAVARSFGMRVTSMADGGILNADTLNLADFLSNWEDLVQPASSSDVSSSAAGRKTQADQYAAAKRALAKAKQSRADKIRAAQKQLSRAYASRGKGRANRIDDAKDALKKAKRTDTIRNAEAKLRKERADLTAATKKLADTEKRYQYARMSPTAKLGAALDLGIKNNATFIGNLQKLADRGFGDLARNLLAMGGADAEKMAADAVKLSSSKLSGLQGKMTKAQQQEDYLAALPNILTVRSARTRLGAAGGSWVALLNATGLGAGDLAAAVHLMAADLAKTGTGAALLADMQRHGYRAGGWIGGPSGIDRIPIMATAGEYVINRQSALRHGPLVEAINSDRVGQALIRHYAQGGRVGPARGGDGASAGGTVVEQHFHEMPFSPSQMAREAAREAAWMIR